MISNLQRYKEVFSFQFSVFSFWTFDVAFGGRKVSNGKKIVIFAHLKVRNSVVMGKLKEKYKRFKHWQEQPYEYKLKSDEVHHCKNCNQDFTGNFCPICSQKADTSRICWSSVRQGVMDIWGLGSRSLLYSIWQLLLRPGHIIADYIDGKRQVCFPPVKMLFIVTLIYSFVIYWFLPDVVHLSSGEENLGEFNEFYLWYKSHLSWAMLIIATFAILPTWVMFRYSPRHTRHTIPEGFFIQVFLQIH